MISLIVAISRNGLIGANNQLPWHIKEDLQHFKTITSGSTIIMGRKTFESIGKPLPNRRNIVLTRDLTFKSEGIEIVHSVNEILSLCTQESETFIIGGGEVYTLLLPYADKLYITLVDIDIQGDTHFPNYANDFIQISSKLGEQVDSTGYNYYFTEWTKL